MVGGALEFGAERRLVVVPPPDGLQRTLNILLPYVDQSISCGETRFTTCPVWRGFFFQIKKRENRKKIEALHISLWLFNVNKLRYLVPGALNIFEPVRRPRPQCSVGRLERLCLEGHEAGGS